MIEKQTENGLDPPAYYERFSNYIKYKKVLTFYKKYEHFMTHPNKIKQENWIHPLLYLNNMD